MASILAMSASSGYSANRARGAL